MTINLDRFTHELNTLHQSLTSWQEEVAIKEAQVLKEKESLKRQREEMIQKSNLIIIQVNGLRGQKEQAEQKMIEAQKLRKSAIEQLETAETMRVELDLEKKSYQLLEEREKKVTERERKIEMEKASLLNDRILLKREQELLDEKQQVILVREKRVSMNEAKQRRILSDL